MNKLKTLLISVIIGLTVAVITIAFTGPEGRDPGVGNPDFWIKSGNDVYYNPAVGGDVGIGTINPDYKLDVRNGQINASGGLCIADVCKTAWSQVAGTNHWTLSGSNLYPNQDSYNVGVGTASLDANYKITTAGGGIKAVSNIASQPAGYFDNPSGYSLITGSGNVGIGTTAPGEKLEVVGNIISKGTSWTSRTSAADNEWSSVVYGNGLFVAVSWSGTGNDVMTSPDGINWTLRTSPTNNSGWYSVTYGNGLFVAVSGGQPGVSVMTSPDGINWTSRTAAVGNQWMSVTYGNSLFVAVANSGTGNRVMTSPDGINWTSRTSAADNYWNSVTYGNGLFVAVSRSGTGNRVMTSPDGINWTSRTSAANNYWNFVTYGNGLFVAVASSGNGNRVMTSPDGISWTSRTSAADNEWYSVTYGNGLFVAVTEYSTAGNNVMTSPDGISWTSRTIAANNYWRSVTYGNGLFVAVSWSGTGNRVMTSGKTESNVLPIQFTTGGGSSQWTTSGSNIYYNTGNVGIGTTGPFSKLNISNQSATSLPASSGATQVETIAALQGPQNQALYIGAYGVNNTTWFQGGNPGDLSVKYAIALQPIGGNVGIGTASPGSNKLEVVGGPIKATGGLIIETRTSDPASPVVGQIWLRTDL